MKSDERRALVILLFVAWAGFITMMGVAAHYKNQIDATNADLDAHCRRELEDYRGQLQECDTHFNDIARELFRCAGGKP